MIMRQEEDEEEEEERYISMQEVMRQRRAWSGLILTYCGRLAVAIAISIDRHIHMNS